jgi:hypothetical protein
MSVQNKIMNVLQASTRITDRVGTRVYPVVMPQGVSAFPSLVYARVSNNRIYSLSGYSSMENVTIQFDSLAEGYDVCRALADAVHDVLVASNTFGCILKSEDDSYEPEEKLYRVTQEFSIWNQE